MKINSPLEIKENFPIKTVKMHVLVHPGYMEDVMSRDPENVVIGEDLFKKYKILAQGLPSNEILIVLIHNNPKRFSKDYREGKKYVKNIKTIQEALPKNKQVIILTSLTVPFSGADKKDDNEALDKIKLIAQNRGYEINPETIVEIFGETQGECVQEAFLGITNADFFNQGNIHIVKELTDKA